MPRTILVVDDNATVREIVARLLEGAGYSVVPAGSGGAALGAFDRSTVEAALVDVDMPEMNGVDLCRALHARAAATGRGIAVWLMTGVVRPELPAVAEAAGALGILAKPFTRAELVACVEQMLARRTAAQALAS